MLKNTLQRAHEEIVALRQTNAILEGQMHVLNVFAAALDYRPPSHGAGVDVAWEIRREIDALELTERGEAS